MRTSQRSTKRYRGKLRTISSAGGAPPTALAWRLELRERCHPGAASRIVVDRVVGVSDSDTLTVLDRAKVQHKIRLSGIGALEKRHAFGGRSKESLSRPAFGRQIAARRHTAARFCGPAYRLGSIISGRLVGRPCSASAPSLDGPAKWRSRPRDAG